MGWADCLPSVGGEGSLWTRASLGTCIVVIGGQIAMMANFGVLAIAVPLLAKDFDESEEFAAWVMLAPMFVSTCASIPAGRFADMFGRKRVWMIGFVLNVASFALCAIAPTLPVLLLGRVLGGLGNGLDGPSGFGLISSHFPPDRREVPVGLVVAANTFAPSLGIVAGGFVIEFLSWRWLFFGPLPFVFLMLVLAHWLVVDVSGEKKVESAAAAQAQSSSGSESDSDDGGVELADLADDTLGDARWTGGSATSVASKVTRYLCCQPESKDSFDIVGSTLFILMVLALLFSINQAPVWGLSSPVVLVVAAFGIFAGVIFVIQERKFPTPVFPMGILKDPVVASVMLSRFFVMGAYMGTFFIAPFFLTEVLGLRPSEVSLLLFARPMSLGFTSLFQGLIKRVVKPPISMAGGAIVTVASFIFGLFWDDNAHVALFVTQMVMQGVGTGWGGPVAMTTALSRVPDDLMSTFAGVMSLMFQVSAIIGMALCLTSVEFFGGVTEPAAFRATFVLALAIGVVGVGFAFAAMGIVLKSSPAGTWEKLEEGKSSGESEDSATDRDADVVVASPSDEEP